MAAPTSERSATKWTETLNQDLQNRHGLSLYDFGIGQTVFPMPDFETGSYLTSTAFFVVSEKVHKALGVEINKELPDIREIADAVAKVFPALAVEITSAGYLPKPILLSKIMEMANA